MTTDDVVSFIRSQIKPENFMWDFGLDKFTKGYIKGMITMASVQQNINLETEKQLLSELDAVMLQAQELATKNTDKSDI